MYVNDAKRALSELMRITKNGGVVYLSFDSIEDDDIMAAHMTLSDGTFQYIGSERDGMLFHYYSDDEIAALFLGDKNVVWQDKDSVCRREFAIEKRNLFTQS